jgi:isoleucyl-tRNA synthetase
MSPFAPFYADQLFQDLNAVSGKNKAKSVHLSDFPKANLAFINKDLEKQMEYAQVISSLVLSIRKKENIKVRQPLQRILIPVVDPSIKQEIEKVKDLILAEVNVKELQFIEAIDKAIKPNFKTLGKKVGSKMKVVAEMITAFNQSQISQLEQTGKLTLSVDDATIDIELADVEIVSKEITGYKVAYDGPLTVALDVLLSEDLVAEGIAREIISKIQNLRKERDFDLTDKIHLKIIEVPHIKSAINQFKSYICSEILANDIQLVTELNEETELVIDEISIKVEIEKFN